MPTRSPMATVSGSTSVSSHWKRPPPSKSITAATTGGLRLNASRSTVNVAIVAGTSAMRTGSIRSISPEPMLTRAGGRWTKPFSSRLPTKAYFQASVRAEGGAAGRSGSGRRGGSRCRNPRHVRNWA